MRITSIKVYKRHLPLKRPYTIARMTIADAEMVFFEVRLSNGITGIGSAATDKEVVGEHVDDTLINLQSDHIASLLVGNDIRCFPAIIDDIRTAYPNLPGTQAAVDLALHDAFGKWAGISIIDFYGRRHAKKPTSVTIGIKGVEESLIEAQEYHDRGFKVLKVKTGLDAELDAERIIKLRERYGDDFVIRVDANTGYNLAQLRQFIRLTADVQVELIEQPLLPGMEDELLTLPWEVRSKLAADESLKNAQSALALCRDKPYGIFNIKLMKCGGIVGALEIANIARQANIDLFWGCNDESIVSITAALLAAFSCRHTQYIDLDGSLDLSEDMVSGGFSLQDGYLIPNEKPGLGISPLAITA